jgi:two-component system, OmpR family, response regulator MtrA
VTLATISVDELIGGKLPLVVCVSPDPGVRERIARQLDGRGIVLMCPDLSALRTLLTDGGSATAPAAANYPDNLVIDAREHEVIWHGKALPLTRLECELLARLSSQPVRVWTYEKLFAAVWGGAYLGDNSILHSAVKRLRRKLREVGDGLSVETVRGIGYRLVVP